MKDKETLYMAQERTRKEIESYRRVLMFMGANVPIQVLCLPTAIEKILLKEKLFRVYDLIDCDFAKIKGIGDTRAEIVAASLDQFLTMSI